jgi:NADH dehydrogenase/NADH:ubiquinone oxidoreductase subunit G
MSTAPKITFTANGKKYEAPEGFTLIQALNMNGLTIPSLCWEEGLEPSLGTCRVCTVIKNGRPVAACTQILSSGDVIDSESKLVHDLQLGIVELLFSEGNHFCPGCEKSGDCDLQGLGYKLGMSHSSFPYQFKPYQIDFSGADLVLERNRCIHCKRCTDLFVDDKGRKVFRFVGKGADTRVEMDHVLEQQMSDHKKKEVVALCPTGAILYKGAGFDRPIGTRKHDIPEQK